MARRAAWRAVLGLCLLLGAQAAAAWWNAGWTYRKPVTLDSAAAGIAAPVADAVVLLRLHSGNFNYFLDLQPQGEDLRLVAGDDATPLAFHIERIDPVNGLADVWVRLPQLQTGAPQSIWLYYGNADAQAASDAAATYPVTQALIYHFDEDSGPPRDATAYGHHAQTGPAQAATGDRIAAALIGPGLRLTGAPLRIAAAPGLAFDPASGLSVGLWIKPQAAGEAAAPSDAVLFERGSADNRVVLRITAGMPELLIGTNAPLRGNQSMLADTWQHIGFTLDGTKARIYLDGKRAAEAANGITSLDGDLLVGAMADGSGGFIGEIDELSILRSVQTDDGWRLQFQQGPQANLIRYGDDQNQDSAGESEQESYFATTLRNVTVDGWVVIGILALMALISWLVMVAKGLYLGTVRRANRIFIAAFQKLRRAGAEEARTAAASPLIGLAGAERTHRASSLFRIYAQAVAEMQQRVGHWTGSAVGADVVRAPLSAQAIDAIRATMDAVLVRETQRLNNRMVLLTIAISGGPFLGLLGTVVGVMITFAAIAASGDVNVNAIAPGIAAALVATVAGLAVAIPALFGYNYLGSRIKEIIADMQVFVDEFTTRLAEENA